MYYTKAQADLIAEELNSREYVGYIFLVKESPFEFRYVIQIIDENRELVGNWTDEY